MRVPEPSGPIRNDELISEAAAVEHPVGSANFLSSIRTHFDGRRERLVVLDDDPTGTQSVGGVPVVTRWDDEDISWALELAAPTMFVLTNSRSLSEPDAVGVTRDIVETVLRVGRTNGYGTTFMSRSDSTLRGHFPAEVDALRAELAIHGEAVDGVVLCPCYHEAGRVTVGDVHWVQHQDGATWMPAASTEYADDATFGYEHSNLRNWIEDRTNGAVSAHDVRTVSLQDVRHGGPGRVADILKRCRGGEPVVVNAVNANDLDVVALGALRAEEAGKSFVYRTGPSLVRARSGMPERGALTSDELQGRPFGRGSGLVVVGSHTALTTRQVEEALRVHGMDHIELDVGTVLEPASRDSTVRRTITLVTERLKEGDVLLSTSRTVVPGLDRADSLAVARRVSTALVDVVAALPPSLPIRYLITKGGNTSSHVITEALGIRRAHVWGNLMPGGVPLWVCPDDADRPELPVAVFPGNVGDASTLAQVVSLLGGQR